MSDVVAIVQARLGSSRLPGKTLEVIYDKSLLAHILERVAAARTVDRITVATTTSAADDAIVPVARAMGANVFRGSENDVLERFQLAAEFSNARAIVRITADDPFKDPEVIDRAVSLLDELKVDYCSNTLHPSFPEGIDVEVFTSDALRTAFRNATLPSEREHVTPYIWTRPKEFKLHNVSHEPDLSSLRWTIDYPADLSMAREVYRQLYPVHRIFLMRDIQVLLERDPSIARLNPGIARNEGYQRSLAAERH